ncbi:AMP-binding protein [uncultured Alistipes sp.]|uniref:AMP-binding protein n=1 Tax=uncultured Alistipes sp. TaxID=538949 RepID=UPI002629FF79|nr:AMP-binding protein [uncultured Alistipes sp.]
MKTLKTLYELVKNSVETFASRTAFVMLGGEEVTYEEVGKRIEHVQELLLGAGLKPGDKVALLSSNMPNWGVCYLAVTTAGMVAVPILPDFTTEELDMIIEHSEAKALMVSDKLFTKISKPTIDRLNIVIRTKNLKALSQNVKAQGEKRIPAPEDLAVVIYTSGTTSKSKGVMLSHAALCAQVDMDYEIFPIDGSDVFLSVLPLSHTYECSIGLIYALSKGAKVVYLDRPPTAAALMPALKQVRPTVMLIVPLVIEKIYKHQVQAKFNSTAFWRTVTRPAFLRRYFHRIAGRKLMKVFGNRLRFLGIGGAKLDADTERFLLEARLPYAIGYGLTETAPLLAGATPDAVRLGSTGTAAPGVVLRLDNINPDTRQGEIVAKTPSIMLGYYKNPEATKEAFTADGWFRTGDLGELGKDGYLYIKGRLKNMIVGPSGENIYPEDIETVLNSHVCVADSIVTQQEGRLVALVHYNTEQLEAKFDEWRDEWENKKGEWERRKEEFKKELLEYVNSKVNRFSRISEVVEEKNEFVRTPTQKIRRFLYTKREANGSKQ